ncbi:MAG: hypothetical protein KF690_12100 [Bacteroidetes bacterium]|nr:hypothetical protein [Bacteroidota bacterium]
MAQPSTEFYQGLGFLSYAFALADGIIDPEEARTFTRGMLKSFGNMPEDKRGKTAVHAFMEARAFQHTVEQAYKEAIRIFMDNTYDFTHHHDKLMGIVQDIVESDDVVTAEEQALIDRFAADSSRMLAEIAAAQKSEE